MKPNRDRTKLPQWAQQEIAKLERDLGWYKEKLTAGPEDSDTFADPYSEARRPLGKGTKVEFVLGDRAYIQAHLNEYGEVEVRSDSMLAVIPWASNVAKIQRVER